MKRFMVALDGNREMLPVHEAPSAKGMMLEVIEKDDTGRTRTVKVPLIDLLNGQIGEVTVTAPRKVKVVRLERWDQTVEIEEGAGRDEAISLAEEADKWVEDFEHEPEYHVYHVYPLDADGCIGEELD